MHGVSSSSSTPLELHDHPPLTHTVCPLYYSEDISKIVNELLKKGIQHVRAEWTGGVQS